MIKRIIFLLFGFLFLLNPFNNVVFAYSLEELFYPCHEVASVSGNYPPDEILYEIKGISFGDNGIVFKGWAVMHDKDNYTLDNLFDNGKSKNTSIYIKNGRKENNRIISTDKLFGSEVSNCNGTSCVTDDGVSFITSEKILDTSVWGWSIEGTYYLKKYNMDKYFTASDESNPPKYYGTYFWIFLPYEKLNLNNADNYLNICVSHNGKELCEPMAISKEYCYVDGVKGCNGNIDIGGVDIAISDLGDSAFINYSRSRKVARNNNLTSAGGYFRWCNIYQITGIHSGKDSNGNPVADGCFGKNAKEGGGDYCPSYFQVKHINTSTTGKLSTNTKTSFNIIMPFGTFNSNYVNKAGLANCGTGSSEGIKNEGCFDPVSSTTPTTEISSAIYLRSNFAKVVGSINLNISSSYELNKEPCNVKNTLRVTTDNKTFKNNYSRLNENRINYNNLYGGNVFYSYNKVNNSYNPAYNGAVSQTSKKGNDNQMGGNCLQTVVINLEGYGNYKKAYANLRLEEISTWDFKKLDSIKAGQKFEFSFGYTSELIWDIVNNVATRNGNVDPKVWILVEDNNEKLVSSLSLGTSVHNEIVDLIEEYVQDNFYKSIDEVESSVEKIDDFLMPPDNATGLVSEKEMESLPGSWSCKVSKTVARSSDKLGERTINCHYQLTTGLDKDTGKVEYENPKVKKSILSEKTHIIYKTGNTENGCITSPNGFCLFSSLTYPCVSIAGKKVIDYDGTERQAGFPIKYYSSGRDETKRNNKNYKKYTVSQLDFEDEGVILEQDAIYIDGFKIEDTKNYWGMNLDVEYSALISVGNPGDPDEDNSFGGELCLMEILDYRPINLNNPFPKYLNSAGYNWTNYLKNKLDKTELLPSDYTSSDIFEKNLDPEYEISLNSGIIKSIKDRYTNNYLSFDGISEVSSKATSSFVSNYFGKVSGRNGIDENKVYKLGCGPANMEWSVCK